MNMGVQISVQVPAFNSLGTHPEVQLLDCVVILFLIFWGTSILFSAVSASSYIPTSAAQGFQFLHIFADTCYFWVLLVAFLRWWKLFLVDFSGRMLCLFRYTDQEEIWIWAIGSDLSYLPSFANLTCKHFKDLEIQFKELDLYLNSQVCLESE